MKKVFLLLFCFVSLISTNSTIQAYKLRVMSFNIRLYNTKADAPLNLWESRRDPLCAYVNSVKPDVFGMQEVFKSQLEDVLARVKGYSYCGVGRDDGKEEGEYSPVFYNAEKYEVVKNGHFWWSETPDQPSFGWKAACRRIATWAILKDKKKGTQFFYCNTHFDHKSVRARIESAKLAKEKFKSLSGGLPVLFTADFNTNEEEETYSLLANYGYPFADAWKVAKKREGGPATFNGWGTRPNDEKYKIDFIFLSPSITVKKAVVHDSTIGGGRFLSDHNALWADVTWK